MERVRAWRKGVGTETERTDESDESQRQEQQPRTWQLVVGGIFGALFCTYIFLVGLELLGESFKSLGGRSVGGMFTGISNPIAGLMIGILATVMVQSSSTTTSIVVGLVGAGLIEVKTGIPLIMGANIGTSVTSTFVSMCASRDPVMLSRAFSAAVLHDMFNMLTVAVLLPTEIIIAFMQGEGGPLYWISKVFTDIAMAGGEASDDPMKDMSPTKLIASPLAKVVISNNKYIIYALTLGAPVARTSTDVNETVCLPLSDSRRLDAVGQQDFAVAASIDAGAISEQQALTSRKLSDVDRRDCSHFFCVVSELDTQFKKIDEDEYDTLVKCEGHISSLDEEKCGDDKCYLNAGQWYTLHVKDRQLIKGGFTEGAGDVAGGMVSLFFSLLMLGGSMIGLCKLWQFLLVGLAKRAIIKAMMWNDYLAILVGGLFTVLVQSSSVLTCVILPFCAIGATPVTKVLAVTMGANIGTTTSALIASLASFNSGAVQIALCHLFFNIAGILIWFPFPRMRRVPVEAAKMLGLYASNYRAFPVIYIMVMFVVLPTIFLGISALYDIRFAFGVDGTVAFLIAFGTFMYWWSIGGCYKVLPEEVRRERQKELDVANRDFDFEGDTGADDRASAQRGRARNIRASIPSPGAAGL